MKWLLSCAQSPLLPEQINTQTVHVYAQLHKEILEELLPVVWIRPATLRHFVCEIVSVPTYWSPQLMRFGMTEMHSAQWVTLHNI